MKRLVKQIVQVAPANPCKYAGESSIFNLQMTVGTILAFTGFAGYSFLRMAAKQKALQASSDHQQSVLKAVQEIESEVQKPLLEKAEPSQDNANRV